MDLTRERISRIFELRETLLSFLVLEACDCLKLLSVYFDLCVDAAGVVCHQLGLLGTDLAVGCEGFVETPN